MYTQITSIEELKQIWIEILLNNTNKVTKIDPESVLNGIAFADSKIGQKTIKDIAILESHIFPDSAYGDYLDDIAANYGIAPRFTASQSSTFVRLVGTVGTVYTQGVNTVSGKDGIIFDFEQNVTIPSVGYTYAKIRSQQTGVKTNVNPNTLNQVTPIPTGHTYIINEYAALGGRDLEQDDVFRVRIKQGANIIARGTLSMLEQVFMKINSNVLRVFYHGYDNDGNLILSILTQNGIDLTSVELTDLLIKGNEYFSLSELNPYNTQSYGIILQNISYQSIDISFRCDLYNGYDPDDIRKEIQIAFAKKYDFRFWDINTIIDWADLLNIARSVEGVKYIPDTYFYPNNDVVIDKNKIPRFRGFLMLNLSGGVLTNYSGTINPIYYPSIADFSYQQTILNSL